MPQVKSTLTNGTTTGRLTFLWGCIAFGLGAWNLIFVQSPLIIIPMVATPIVSACGILLGIVGWATHRKTDAQRCIAATVMSLVALLIWLHCMHSIRNTH
jgi:hypothetical protein